MIIISTINILFHFRRFSLFLKIISKNSERHVEKCLLPLTPFAQLCIFNPHLYFLHKMFLTAAQHSLFNDDSHTVIQV